MLDMQNQLFQQQMKLGIDLKTRLTKWEPQDALTATQMRAAEFVKRLRNLNARYFSARTELTDTKLPCKQIKTELKQDQLFSAHWIFPIQPLRKFIL